MANENNGDDIKKEKLKRLIEGLDAAEVPSGRGRVKAVAKMTGYSEGMVSRILAGKVEPADKFITAICYGTDLNRFWIENGKGTLFDMEKLKTECDALGIKVYASANKPGNAMNADQMRAYADSLKKIPPQPQMTPEDMERADREVFGLVSDERKALERTILTVLQKRWLTDEELAQVEKLISGFMEKKK